MKPNYEKLERFYKGCNHWNYGLRWGGYCRPIRTAQELRQREADRVDGRAEGLGVKRRGNRGRCILDAWNDYPTSRCGGRSWKDYTKRRRQYGKR